MANLSKANLSNVNLRNANLSAASVTGATLRKANLIGANLSGANLVRASFIDADLSSADLSDADLSIGDLSGADLSEANLQNAILIAARLLDTNLNRANLSCASLWETQRAGWSIKGVICESIYWDQKHEKSVTYKSGDFERLYSEKARIHIKYSDGINSIEIATLPALIQHLESSHPGTKLRLESIQDASGGAVVSIVFEDLGNISSGDLEERVVTIQSEAENIALILRTALEEEKQTVLILKGELRALDRTIDKLVSRQKQTIYLTEGDLNMSSDTYNVGQAGAVGPNSHAHDMTFQQIGSQIEKSMDLAQLAEELTRLRQSMAQEANDPDHYIAIGEVAKAEQAAAEKNPSNLAESLKASGKWALDVATKIGVSLATEAIKQSMK